MTKAKRFWVTDSKSQQVTEIAFRDEEVMKRMLIAINKDLRTIPVIETSHFEKFRQLILQIKYDLINSIWHRPPDPKDPEKVVALFSDALKKKRRR